MRNALTVLCAGSMLCGCLGSDESELNDYITAASDSSGNSRPTITGNPQPAILYNEMYVFEPKAADPDGDALTFRVSNKPGWASFDASTGRLYGQPVLRDVGTYGDIVISVTDGNASNSLSAFSVTVSQTALGNVTLSWLAPTENSDGTPLQDLAGYKIFYGRESGIYDHEIRIDSPSISTYVVENLTPDTYYFAATSFNSAGVESLYSGELVRTVD